MNLMTTEEQESCTKYKWAHELVTITHSAIELLVTLLPSLLLQAWHWTVTIWNNSQDLSFSVLANYFHSLWNSISATMTIEVISTETETETIMETGKERRSVTIPTLRLNSQNIEDYLNDNKLCDSEKLEDLILGSCCSVSSNYNTSDGEHDSGLVFTDPEENDSIDGVTSTDHIPAEPHTNGRRDSDSSDISSDGQENNENDNGQLSEKLLSQVETMFSNDHLAKDGFLLKHVRRRSDGYVSLKLVAGLRKVKQISRDFDVILQTLRKSEKLEVNAEGSKIRRIEPLTQFLKSLPTTGNKDKENNAKSATNGASSDSAQDEFVNRVNMRNNYGNGPHKKIHRNNSNASTCSSNGSSRNGSFSMPYHPGSDLMYRNMMVYHSNEEGPQIIRRRGGSLPMPMVMPGDQSFLNGYPYQHYQNGPQGQRNSMYLVPNLSPPSGAGFQQRPKSNSYCEGVERKNSTGGMSLWLQRRLANSRSSEGSIVTTGVIRQPRGPDGTKGFAAGYREQILKEREALALSHATL